MNTNIFDSLINSISKENYTIAREVKGQMWYLYDVDTRKGTKQVMWTAQQSNAIMFSSKEEAIDIKDKYLIAYITDVKKLGE